MAGDHDSDSDSDELGIGHRQQNRAWGGSHSVVESGAGDTDDDSFEDVRNRARVVDYADYR